MTEIIKMAIQFNFDRELEPEVLKVKECLIYRKGVTAAFKSNIQVRKCQPYNGRNTKA